jgi:AcrR family transcriptional regulator
MFMIEAADDTGQKQISESVRFRTDRRKVFGMDRKPAVMAVDRRVRRTRLLLHQALIELMTERDYTRITVQDIIDRADVGRSTFYAHYRDKDDLLLVSCTEYTRETLATGMAKTQVTGTAPLFAPIGMLFGLVAEHRVVYRALLGPKSNAVVLRATRQMYAEVLTEHLADRLGMESAEFDTTITFLSWGMFGLLTAVAQPGSTLTADEAFRRFRELAETGLTDRLRAG